MNILETLDTSRKRARPTNTDIDVILNVARDIMNKQNGSSNTEDRRFREMFGCSPLVVLELWKLILLNVTIKGSPEVAHLLWALISRRCG